MINLTQFLARQWATETVRVNAISPGFFPAEQNKALLYNSDGTLSPRGQQIIGHTPMARFGNPDELAGATVFLASSKASSFVTGQNIVVDGGFSFDNDLVSYIRNRFFYVGDLIRWLSCPFVKIRANLIF